MAVSDEDKAKMRRLGETLEQAEIDDPGTPEERQKFLAEVNARRKARGLPPLKDEHEERPEEELYRRARALGMRRIDRSDL